MADFTGRVVTVTRHEYALESPTNAVEVSKMLNSATRDFQTAKGQAWDDSITVESRNGEIVAWWEEG